jgi:hypothetical protein
MNIFFLDYDPKLCAKYHNDKHVVKMILETAQLLCGAHHLTKTPYEIPYKLSHKNHPCSIWVRHDLHNYKWLVELGFELCYQYTLRYGKRHKSQDVIEWCTTHYPNIPNIKLTTPPLAMPDEYKLGDVVISYRNYYCG